MILIFLHANRYPLRSKTLQARLTSHENFTLHGIVTTDSSFRKCPSHGHAVVRPTPVAREPPAGHLIPLLAAVMIATPAITAVAYLLWPTWTPKAPDNNERLPVSIGQTVFNVPKRAFRVKIQRHSGPQERIDLNFLYPSLATPDAPRHVTAETAEDGPQPIDRIFLSIAAHHDSPGPDILARTIYPRYLDETHTQPQDGLSIRAFRDGTPYAGEYLLMAQPPAPDYDDFESKRSKIMSMIDSNILERDARGKPLHTLIPL